MFLCRSKMECLSGTEVVAYLEQGARCFLLLITQDKLS
jgi:hypothetical protein